VKQRQRRNAPHPYASLVRSVRRLDLRAGDVLVVHVPGNTDRAIRANFEAVHRLVVRLKETLGRPALPVLILPTAYELSTITPPEEPAVVEHTHPTV
jgi:hypothetical protein